MDTMKLFMAIPDRINFLQLGRYGCFSEQTYRNLLRMIVWVKTSLIGIAVILSVKRQDTENIQNGGCGRILFQGNFHNAYV